MNKINIKYSILMCISFVIPLIIYALYFNRSNFGSYSLQKIFSQSRSSPLYVLADSNASCPLAFQDVTKNFENRYIRLASNGAVSNKEGGVDKPNYLMSVKENQKIRYNYGRALGDLSRINVTTTSPSGESMKRKSNAVLRQYGAHRQKLSSLPPFNLYMLFCGNSPNLLQCAPLNTQHTGVGGEIFYSDPNCYDNNTQTSCSKNSSVHTVSSSDFHLPRSSFKLCQWGM